jgi:hypothetical protein
MLVTVTTTEVDEPRFSERFILRALVIALLLHLLAFYTYKTGQSRGWWANLAMPRWMQSVLRVLAPAVPKNFVPVTPPHPTQLSFVQVDPANAVPEAPKAPKFYGANNTLAANPNVTKPSDVPDIRGRQDKVLKTIENGKPKAQPAQPTPPAQPQPHAQAQPQPQPHAATEASAPQKTYVPGDLAMAKPAEMARDNDAKSDTKTQAQTAVEAQAQPQPQPQPQPVYQRPRTIAEAMARNGTIGAQSLQTGGVNRSGITSSLDVKGTIAGAYDEQFVQAVQAKWDQLWNGRTPNSPGKVVLSFRLLPNGKITKLSIVQNEVSELMANYCERAITEPQPYMPWPQEMLLEFPSGYRDIQFTFIYEQY